MKITSQTLLSLLRATMVFVGTFLIGHKIANQTITTEVWSTVLESLLTVVGAVWGFLDKSAGIEQLESAFRSVAVSVGGLLVGWGVIKDGTLQAFLVFATAVVPIILSYTSKVKVVRMENGKVSPDPKKVGLVVDNNKRA